MSNAQIDAPEYYSHDQSELLKLVTVSGNSALEIGCANGNMLNALTARGYGRLTGVELIPSVADMARVNVPHATILAGDFNKITDDEIGSGYDLIVVSHVLEHFTDPWAVLARLVGFLRPGGQIVGALPNIQHISVTLPLVLKGRFDYQDDGILDRTHFRFFTRSTVRQLLESAPLTDIRIMPWIGGGKSAMLNRLTLSLLEDNFCFAYRFSAVKK